MKSLKLSSRQTGFEKVEKMPIPTPSSKFLSRMWNGRHTSALWECRSGGLRWSDRRMISVLKFLVGETQQSKNVVISSWFKRRICLKTEIKDRKTSKESTYNISVSSGECLKLQTTSTQREPIPPRDVICYDSWIPTWS